MDAMTPDLPADAWYPTAAWLEERARSARSYLDGLPFELLGPAARTLRSARAELQLMDDAPTAGAALSVLSGELHIGPPTALHQSFLVNPTI